LDVKNTFGEIPRRLDAYNWTTASFDEIAAGDTIDLDLYRNPVGDVMVRARASADAEEAQVLELPMSPYAFVLEWET
jgi:hypothetical protein